MFLDAAFLSIYTNALVYREKEGRAKLQRGDQIMNGWYIPTLHKQVKECHHELKCRAHVGGITPGVFFS